MTVVGWAASAVLGAVFLLSGGLKVNSPAWPAHARQLGVPKPIALVVAWVELLVGGALVARLAVPIVPIVALVMLVLFTALIGLRLARGRRPVCACFGHLSVRPIGPDTIVRNLVFMGLAAVAMV